MAAYLAMRIIKGKLSYSKVIEVYGQYKDDIDEILVLEGMEHLKENARNRGKKGILLTCKDEKLGFYEGLGFTYDGVSGSSHGGARWNDMILKFS